MNNRQLEIMNIILDKSKINVSELAERFKVSEVTVRQDLKLLEQEGMLKRIHGGAVASLDDDIMKRMPYNFQSKRAIARKAASLIGEGETIIMESGSTNALLARELTTKSDVSIITNSTFIGRYIRGNKHIKITVLGGEYQHEAEVLVGPLTRYCLEQVHVGKAFIGVDGFSPESGFTCLNLMRAEVAQAMAERTDEVIVITDSTKFSKIGVATSLIPKKVDRVITDSGIDDGQRDILEGYGIEVTTAEVYSEGHQEG